MSAAPRCLQLKVVDSHSAVFWGGVLCYPSEQSDRATDTWHSGQDSQRFSLGCSPGPPRLGLLGPGAPRREGFLPEVTPAAAGAAEGPCSSLPVRGLRRKEDSASGPSGGFEPGEWGRWCGVRRDARQSGNEAQSLRCQEALRSQGVKAGSEGGALAVEASLGCPMRRDGGPAATQWQARPEPGRRARDRGLQDTGPSRQPRLCPEPEKDVRVRQS